MSVYLIQKNLFQQIKGRSSDQFNNKKWKFLKNPSTENKQFQSICYENGKYI